MVFINLSTDNKARPIGSDIIRLRWSSILLWTLNLSITESLGFCDFLLTLPCVKISQILWDICQHLPILLSTLGYPWGTYTWCHSWFKLMSYIQLRAVNVVMPSLAFSIHLYIRWLNIHYNSLHMLWWAKGSCFSSISYSIVRACLPIYILDGPIDFSFE